METIQSAALELKKLVGSRLDDEDPYQRFLGRGQPMTEITKDSIRRYAWGVGDLNPLWHDGAYRSGELVGGTLAPPSILFALTPGGMSGTLFTGLPIQIGTHETWGGADLTWHKPLRAGTHVHARTRLSDVTERTSRLSGTMAQLSAHTEYRDDMDAMLAESDVWVFRMADAAYKGTPADRKLRRWSQDELDAIREMKRVEAGRGSKRLSWDEIEVGQTVPPLVKGPYTLSANTMFLAAWSPEHVSFGDVPWTAVEQYQGAFEADICGVPELRAMLIHCDRDVAFKYGLAGPFDYGPQRVSWAIQLVTNWMGDHSHLKQCRFRVRGFNFLGDLQTFKAVVTSKSITEGEGYVGLDLSCANQDGEPTGDGSAIVSLGRLAGA